MAAGKAASVFRGFAVAGGGESSDSEDDGWEIGYRDRASQVAEEAFSSLRLGLPPLALEDPASPRNLFLPHLFSLPPLLFQWKYGLWDLRQTRNAFV